MHMLFTSLSERIDKLESGLEQRISTKVAQLLDKRVNVELGRIKKDVDSKLNTFRDTLREEVADDLQEINDKLSSIATPVTNNTPDISLNVVIRNLPESTNENVNEKVNLLIANGLKINSVSVASTERKQSNINGRAGVVIAKFKTSADKSKVMSSKASLKNNRQFPDVFIHNDQSRDDRLMSSNFKTMIDAINRGDKLSLHGSRVVNNRNNFNGNTRANSYHTNRGSSRSRSDNSIDTSRSVPSSSSSQNSGLQDQNSNRQHQNSWTTVNGRRGGRGNGRRGNGHRGRY